MNDNDAETKRLAKLMSEAISDIEARGDLATVKSIAAWLTRKGVRVPYVKPEEK